MTMTLLLRKGGESFSFAAATSPWLPEEGLKKDVPVGARFYKDPRQIFVSRIPVYIIGRALEPNPSYHSFLLSFGSCTGDRFPPIPVPGTGIQITTPVCVCGGRETSMDPAALCTDALCTAAAL